MKYGLVILTVCLFSGALRAQDGPDPLGFNAKWNNALELKSNDGSASLKVGGRIMLDNAWFSIPFTKVLLDPPRSGAIEIIQQIVDLRVSKIVYVSCNPATLARDAKFLVGNGYRLKSAGVMDMFPHTAHVESMAEFELVDV